MIGSLARLMDRRTVQLQVGGQSYRVVSSVSAEDLQRLVQIVEGKLDELGSRGKRDGMLLAAMALAHDVESERGRREDVERRTRDLLRRVLVRIDDALEYIEAPDEDAGE
jgi:cell division protein ZapA